MEDTLGEIRLFGGGYPPRGWAFCDGQLLRIPLNSALFSILLNSYGGDGRTNFALPNLESPRDSNGNPVGAYMICVAGNYPGRQ